MLALSSQYGFLHGISFQDVVMMLQTGQALIGAMMATAGESLVVG